jgi:hypothetical protein
MTKFDQLRLEVRVLRARLDRLEARRQRQPKREAAPRPTDAIIAGRKGLWDRFILLQVGRGPTSKLAFAVKHHLGDASEFRRFFSASDKRGICEGSAPAVRYYRALNDAIAELEGRDGDHKSSAAIAAVDSHGSRTGSHFLGARPQ